MLAFAALVALTPLRLNAKDQSLQEFYGSNIQLDVLDNQPVKEADVDYRFRAAKSGAVKGFHWFDK